MTAHRFEQSEGALHIGLNERARAVDAAVHMALGSEVHNRAWLVLGQQAVEQGAVPDVALHEHMARVALQGGEAFQVAGVGQRVEVQHRFAGRGDPIEKEVRADEAGAAGDENHDGCVRETRKFKRRTCRHCARRPYGR